MKSFLRDQGENPNIFPKHKTPNLDRISYFCIQTARRSQLSLEPFRKLPFFCFAEIPYPLETPGRAREAIFWVAQILDLLLLMLEKNPNIFVPNDQNNGRKQRITLSFNNSKYIRLKIISIPFLAKHPFFYCKIQSKARKLSSHPMRGFPFCWRSFEQSSYLVWKRCCRTSINHRTSTVWTNIFKWAARVECSTTLAGEHGCHLLSQ